MGPLTGIRIIEMANVISGPFAGATLVDLGADVVKVELPGTGDAFRRWDGVERSVSSSFAAFNRGKRSVTVDVRTPEGREVFLRLAAGADVVIENFRPGTLDRWGVGFDVLSAENEGLVYCAISGMGATGPYADQPTFDQIAQALSGLWSQLTDMDDPEPVGPPLCDQLSGLYATVAILAALHERSRSGRGQRIDVSMLGAGVAFQAGSVANLTTDGRVATRSTRPRASLSFAFVAGDGRPFAIHLSTPDKFWRGLVDAVERPELLQDERFATKAGRMRHYEELRAELAERFATGDRAEWLARLKERDVPAGPINTIQEALADPQVEHLRLLRRFGDGDGRSHDLVRVPADFSRTDAGRTDPAPVLGEHTEEILSESGYSPRNVEELRASGAI